jgi:D-serine deaminase-like pyridoxal phosphate-dependent protein
MSDSSRDRTDGGSLDRERSISPLNKGLGELSGPSPVEELAGHGWNLLREDLSLPVAVLYEEKLQHNLRWMQEFVTKYQLKLAPHGKTTMAPQLFLRQLDAGAWGITLATAQQARVAFAFGVRRVLMANQLVGKQNREIIAELLKDEGFEFFCLVDSAELAEQLGTHFQNGKRKLNVLVEIGVHGGRTGVRTPGQLESLLTTLDKWKGSLCVAGVELYEGVLDDESAIRDFLRTAIATARRLSGKKQFGRSPFIVSGAGSAWYDVVADEFSKAGWKEPVELVLRPGCYLTHDVGVYRAAQEQILKRNPIAKEMQSGLAPALQLWTYVQSVPEPEKAIIALGKRDAAFDSGLPTPALHFRPGNPSPALAESAWKLTKMMDQHAYLQIRAGDDIRVGDMIGFDISHPCLTFDKWRYLPILDANYNVIDAVQTFF